MADTSDFDQTQSFVALAKGTAVAHYKILEKIGAGGMGDVYLADDTLLNRLVALKFLPTHMCKSPDAVSRFQREAQAAARFSHPNIVAIHEVDQFHGRPYIVLEYIEGRSLKDVVSGERLGLNYIVGLCSQICDGLESAHNAGVVHRDLKLSNVIVDRHDHVHLIDFGLAAVKDADHLTEPGHVMGTYGYMSPEQVAGEEVDHRSDIFSFGIVLYELLTGRHPFLKENAAATLHAITSENPEPIVHYRGKVSEPLQQMVDKALEKNRNLRYQHIDEVRTDLERYMFGSNITPKSRKPWAALSRVVPVIVVVAIIALGFNSDLRRLLLDKIRGGPKSMETHLAVLPFLDLSDNSTGQMFCDGLRETLTSSLTQMQQFEGSLLVVPANEVTRRGVESVREARKAFGVSMVVTGSVQQLGERFRLALNLVDTESERQIRSEVIDIMSDQLPALQDSTVSKMSAMLRVHIRPEERSLLSVGGTDVPEAYSAYLTGLGFLQRYDQLQSVDSAIARFQKAANLDARYALAYAGLGEAYWRRYEITNEPDWVTQATGNARLALALNDSLGPVHLTLGGIYRGTGAYKKAYDEYNLALKTMPDNHTVLRGLARTLEELGQATESEETYKKVISLYPSYWAGYFDLAMFYIFANRHEDALEPSDRAARLVPQNVRDLNDIGALYIMLNQYDRAITLLEQSLALEPTYPAFSNLGYIHYTRHHFEPAALAYEQALELNESDHFVWCNLASAYEVQFGRGPKARQAYLQAIVQAKKSLQVSPEDPVLLASLAQYYAMTGDSTEAQRFVDASLLRGRTDTEALVRIVFALENIGDRKAAIQYVNEAISLGYPTVELLSLPGLEELMADSAVKPNP